MSYLSLTPEDKKILNDLKKKKTLIGYDNLSQEEKLSFTKLRTIEKELNGETSFKETFKKNLGAKDESDNKNSSQQIDSKIFGIEDNKILIFLLFWGIFFLLVWSPWIEKTSSVTEYGAKVKVHCKNVDSISVGEIYENAKSTGLDISYEDAQNMAREVNSMPPCD